MTKKDMNTQSESLIYESGNPIFGYKIVRLVSGDDLICGAIGSDDDPDILYLSNPMQVIYKRISAGTALVLLPWLPVEFVEVNEARIHSKDILTVLEPNKRLIDYYEKTLDKLLEVLEDSQETLNKPYSENSYREFDTSRIQSEDDSEDVNEEYKFPENITIH